MSDAAWTCTKCEASFVDRTGPEAIRAVHVTLERMGRFGATVVRTFTVEDAARFTVGSSYTDREVLG